MRGFLAGVVFSMGFRVLLRVFLLFFYVFYGFCRLRIGLKWFRACLSCSEAFSVFDLLGCQPKGFLLLRYIGPEPFGG